MHLDRVKSFAVKGAKKLHLDCLLSFLKKLAVAHNLDRRHGVMAGATFGVLLVSFLIFNNLPVSFARRWDIEWGYYSILLTFILLLAGLLVNLPVFVKGWKNVLPSGKVICALTMIILVFSGFMFGNISNTHRVLSDETSWESMGLQMFYQQSGGICNEGVWTGDSLNCMTEVNNFKGKALGFVYSLVFNFAEPNRDTALLVNYPFYVLSLIFFFLALAKWFKNEWAALAAVAFLGGMPIYLLQARSASTEVLYIFLLTVLMAWYAYVPASKVNWKHFLLTVPLLGFFAQTRQETVFAFVPFALYYYKYFMEKPYRLPLFVASVIAVSWPSVNTMAAYRGYDFQGGEHAAHSLSNFFFNMKTNIEIMMNLEEDPAFGGILANPFYTTFTVLLLLATVWLLVRMIAFKRYRRGALLAFTFCFQIFVILLNVSGTFTIDINQRYVLVALPLFALIMALALYDVASFASKMKFFDFVDYSPRQRMDVIGMGVFAIACVLSMGLMVWHGNSFRNNMLYYKNKLLGEEDFLDKTLESYPRNSIFIYSRPWQMLASGHSSFSERTFMGWDTETFAKWMQESGGNIYMVRGQDGFGELNRKSRVVGFKTTDQVDEILKDYKSERVLLEPRLFGYPLAIYKIVAKRGVSSYQQNFVVSENNNNVFNLNKRFPETIICQFLVNDIHQKELMIAEPSLSVEMDTSAIHKGLNRAIFECAMPDNDTVRYAKDFFVEDPSVLLLSSLKYDSYAQDWGEPQINESVEHHRMSLDKEPFRYGIGSHANSSVRFTLPSAYNVFHVTIGLDDESACGDGASFIVAGNGRELFRSKRMYSSEKQAVDVDVSGVRSLELRLDMGENKDCDHGDWANAWLEKSR